MAVTVTISTLFIISPCSHKNPPLFHHQPSPFPLQLQTPKRQRQRLAFDKSGLIQVRVPRPIIGCSSSTNLQTCKNCKTQFDPLLNHPTACRFHTAHFGGETKRKFESVYAGGTLDTPDSGKVFQYWHCCGSEDPFDPGCTAAPHASYDD